MRSQTWIRRNRDRLFVAAALSALVIAAALVVRGWAAMQEPGEAIAPRGWRMPDPERLAIEFVASDFERYWNDRLRQPFREVPIGVDQANPVQIGPPLLPHPQIPLPPSATGALRLLMPPSAEPPSQ